MEDAGEFVIVPGRRVFRVYEKDGRLNYRFSVAGKEWGPAVPPIKMNAPWFAYIETANRVWIHDGANDLVLLRYEANQRNSGTYSIQTCGPWLRDEVPPQVAERVGPLLNHEPAEVSEGNRS
jgi:hypothetical protein